MAIQKFEVPADVLPLIWSDGKFYLRYRIITEDGAVTSDWSNLYDLDTTSTYGSYAAYIVNQDPSSIYLNVSVTRDNAKMLVQWDAFQDARFANVKFDLFVKWAYDSVPTYDSDWTYTGTTAETSQYITIPTNISSVRATFVKVRLQVASQDTQVSDTLLLEQTSDSVDISTVYVSDIDGGVL